MSTQTTDPYSAAFNAFAANRGSTLKPSDRMTIQRFVRWAAENAACDACGTQGDPEAAATIHEAHRALSGLSAADTKQTLLDAIDKARTTLEDHM